VESEMSTWVLRKFLKAIWLGNMRIRNGKDLFHCEKCRETVTAKSVVFDGVGNVTLWDEQGHAVTYTGMKRLP
jgi:hypothetical protein